MKKRLTLNLKIATVILVFAVATIITLLSVVALDRAHKASARTTPTFNPGRIIDDVVFYNNKSMNSGQIQTFLNSKVPKCDTQGAEKAWDKNRGDITRAEYATTVKGWHGPPYVCLRDYKQNTPQVGAASGLCSAIPAFKNRSAAQIIKDVADACKVNPQVLIVLLDKEQSLVSDVWPLKSQYERATGFDCPDNVGGYCDPQYAGFFKQVYSAAKQYKIYKAEHEDPTHNGRTTGYDYNYRAGENNFILWQTNGGNFISDGRQASKRNGQCGRSQVFIENQATAGLYIYTPYRPNTAALNALSFDTGRAWASNDSCSAYGNRNFWFMFTKWFGSTTYTLQGAIGSKYSAVNGSNTLGKALSGEIDLATGGKYQQFEKGRIYWKAGIGAWDTKGSINSYHNSKGKDAGIFGYPTSSEITIRTGAKYQQFEKGRIYWIQGSPIYALTDSIEEYYIKTSGHGSRLGLPAGNEVVLSTGGKYQQFEKGRIYWKDDTGAWSMAGSIGDRYYKQLKADESALGYPTTGEITIKPGVKYQQFEKGRIYWSSKTAARSVYGKIGEQYIALDAINSRLGLPTTNELGLASGGRYQQFEKGRIYWKNTTDAWDVGGSIGSLYTQLGGTNSKLGYPTSTEVKTTNAITQQFEKGTITYSNKKTTYTVQQ